MQAIVVDLDRFIESVENGWQCRDYDYLHAMARETFRRSLRSELPRDPAPQAPKVWVWEEEDP
jgi:hypothetical protein